MKQVPANSDLARAEKIRLGCHRLLLDQGFAALNEVTLAIGRRVDLLALNGKAEFWIIEIKSCEEDFRTDRKWPEYLNFADYFLFAVDPDFPEGLLPESEGMIIADQYGGEIIKAPQKRPLAPARRQALLRQTAFLGARRHSEIELRAFSARFS